MALTIKHLNTDASFQLTFTPTILPSASPSPSSPTPPPPPFHILLDPWITGPAKILHPKISLTSHQQPACIASLTQLPTPDLVIISQAKADHCHEATLRQLPRDGPTLVLAAPAAARTIRAWRHFDPRKVRALRRYDDDDDDDAAVVRVPLPGGAGGEVTVAWIPQRRDITGLHAAVGITFRPPPPLPGCGGGRDGVVVVTTTTTTPPATPQSWRGGGAGLMQREVLDFPPLGNSMTSPPQPPPPPVLPAAPASPTPTRSSSARSASTTPPPTTTLTPTLTETSTLLSSSSSAATTATAATAITTTTTPPRPLSLLFAPHGLPYAGALAAYATTHLREREAALPLTALLHGLDRVSNPWWLGGPVLLGAPAGRATAARLGARAWVRCHDGAKEVRGWGTRWLRTRRWGVAEVQAAVGREGARVLDLGSGEEVVLTAEGVLAVY